MDTATATNPLHLATDGELLLQLDLLADQIRVASETSHDSSRLLSQWWAISRELGRRRP